MYVCVCVCVCISYWFCLSGEPWVIHGLMALVSTNMLKRSKPSHGVALAGHIHQVVDDFPLLKEGV